MKVNIYETVEINDEQRVRLANVLDGEIAKPKRIATRDEIKDYVWSKGDGWETSLADDWNEAFADEEDATADEDVAPLVAEDLTDIIEPDLDEFI